MLTEINVNIFPEFTLAGNEGAYTTLIVGKATFGPENAIVSVSDLKTVENYFKSGDLVDGAKYYFYGGGSNLKLLRVVPDDAEAAEKIFNNSNAGENSGIKIIAKYKGSYGNNIYVNISSDGNKKIVKISDGKITEKYEGENNDEIVNAINQKSALAKAEKLSDDKPDDTTGDIYLTGGSDGTFSDDTYFSTIQNAAYTEDYDMLVVVGNTSDALHSQLSNLMNSRAENENKYSIFIGGVAKNESINDAKNRSSTGGRVVVVYGWTNEKDGSFVAAAYAGLLSVLDVYESPIRKNVGVKTITKKDLYGNVVELTKAEKQQLDAAGFTIIENGVVVNDRTKQPSSEWNSEVEAVRKVDEIVKRMVAIANGYIGKPNDNITRNSLKQDLAAFLNAKANERIIEKDFVVNVKRGADPREVVINATIKLVYSVKVVTINIHLTI